MLVRAVLFISVFWGLCGFVSLSSAALPDFTEIVEASSPAVVKILVEYEAENPRYQEELEAVSYTHLTLPTILLV